MQESHEDVKVYTDEHGDVHSATAQGADEATIRIPQLVHNPEAQVKSWPARLTVSRIRPVKQSAAALAALATQQKLAPSSKTMIQNVNADGIAEKKAAKEVDSDAKDILKRWAHLLS